MTKHFIDDFLSNSNCDQKTIRFFGLCLFLFGLITIFFEFIFISKLEDKFSGLLVESVIIILLGAFCFLSNKKIYNWINRIFPNYYGIIFYILCLIIILLIFTIAFTILNCNICILIVFVMEIIICIIYIIKKMNKMQKNNSEQKKVNQKDCEYTVFGTIGNDEEKNFIITEEQEMEVQEEYVKLEQEYVKLEQEQEE